MRRISIVTSLGANLIKDSKIHKLVAEAVAKKSTIEMPHKYIRWGPLGAKVTAFLLLRISIKTIQ